MPYFDDPAYGYNQPQYDGKAQLSGILGGMNQGGVLGGPQPSSFVPFGQPSPPRPGPLSSIGLALVAGLAGGRDMQSGLAEAGQNAQYVRAKLQDDGQKQAINDWLKAGAPKDIQHPAVINLFKHAPALAQSYIGQMLAPKQKPEFTKIGEDQMGAAQYGWADPNTQSVTPFTPPGQAAAGSAGGGNPGDLYNSLKGPEKQMVDAMVDGRQAIPSSFALRSPYWQRLVAAAHDKEQAAGNPEGFDATKWAARLQTRKEFAAGGPNTPAGVISTGNTAIGHLGSLYDQVDKLGNFQGVPIANYVLNVGRNAALGGSGNADELQRFRSIRDKYVEEATKFYRGVGGSESDIKRDIATLDEASSPSELKAAIGAQVDLMQSKIDAMQERWHRTMGDIPFPIIDKKAQAALDRIRGGAAPASDAAAMTVTVHGPGGVTVHFPDGTDNATIDQVMRHATGMDAAPQAEQAPPDAGGMDATLRGIARGASANWMDEISGGIGGALDAGLGAIDRATGMELGPAGSKGTFSSGYDRTVANARAMDQAADVNHPYLSAGGQIAGGLGSLVAASPAAVVGRGLSLGGRVVQGAKIGAGYGAVSGAGAAEGGVGNRIAGAAEGAATGALTGGALPIAGRLVKIAAKPVTDAITARLNPAGFAATKVTERLGNAGLSVDQAADRIDRAAVTGGDSMSLADVGGDSIRKLGRSVVNTPGPGQVKLMTRANLGAMAQGGRIGAKVDEALGTPGLDYQEAKNAIMDARSHAARPFYDQFYQTPVPYTHQLEEVLNTPAGRAGLAAARTNSLNRREPWAQWFLNVGEDGRLIDARRVPDARALDEVRRTIRAQMEEAMAPPHGQPFARPRDTPRSIAIRTVFDDLTHEMMRAGETRRGAANGPFARANAAGLDNIQADEAIEFGRDIFKTDPRIITRRMGMGGAGRDRVFNAGQQEAVRIGAADAIREKLGATNFTHNGLLKFFSSREDLARLRPLFRSADDWSRFRTSMFNEARKRKTYEAFKGNSTTAGQLADMQEAGTLADVAQTGVHAAHSGIVSAAASAVIRTLRRVGGMTPQVGDQIARIISTRDPAQVRGILRQLHNIELSKATQAQRLNAMRNLLTAAAAAQEGRAMAPRPNEPAALTHSP